MASKRRVWLCFEKHQPSKRGVWSVKFGGKWITGDAITSTVPLKTMYRGPKARQPKAYLHGWAECVTLTYTGRIMVQ